MAGISLKKYKSKASKAAPLLLRNDRIAIERTGEDKKRYQIAEDKIVISYIILADKPEDGA